jgi:hypothetical protein
MMIFSADLVQRLDDGVPCRLPPTYVGVRRVRDNNNAVMIQRVTPPALFERDYDCHRNNLDDQLKLRATNDGGVVSDCVTACDPQNVVGRDVREDLTTLLPTTSSSISSSATTATAGICYMINGRRMTKAEKREMKHKLKLEAHSVRKEAKARDVKERIRKEKAAKAERRLHKAQEKRRQRVQQQCDETTKKFNNNNDLLLPSAATELLSDIVIHHNDDNKDEKKGSSSNLLTENTTSNNDATSNSSSVRKDYLPAMLTPAATRVAQELGILPLPDDDHDPAYRMTTSSATTTMMTTTIMDPILSAKWANALQQSMIPIEMAREKEDIRPMAYRLVPETWRRLCPNTLWIPPAKRTTAITSCNDGKSDSNMTSSLSSSSHVRIRNSSSTTTTTYDDDTYAIVSHLHNHSNIHITCGASFGCDYLLYDGRRTERHSFAGLRVYHCCGGVKKKNGTTITNTNGNDGSDDFELPMPSAYDMTGFVRTMNTARKIALIAMVVTTIEDDDNTTGNKDDKEEEEDAPTIMTPRNNTTIRRIAIVDLALEKVLTAHAHIRKGNTAKRRTEEDAVSGLAKKR